MGRLRTLAWYTLAFFAIAQAGLAAAILYWPEFRDNLGAVRVLTDRIPMMAEFLEEIEATGAYGYIAGQHFFKMCSTLGCAAAVLFAVGAVAGEVHRGTFEILLARPQSRARVLFERYAAGLLALAVPIFATSASIPALARQVGEEVALRSVLLGSVHQLVFLSTIYGATFLASALGSNPIKIAVGMLFGTTFCFAVYMVKVVSRFSPFRLADIADFVAIDRTGRLDPYVLLPLLGVTGVLYACSYAAFRRRTP